MKKLNENEMYEINGGVSGTFINSVASAAKFIYNLGHSLGSTLKRLISGNQCLL